MAASSREAADLELIKMGLRVPIAQFVIGHDPQALPQGLAQLGKNDRSFP